MDSLAIVSGAVFFVCLLLFSVAYILDSRQVNMKSVQRVARKLGLFSIMVILFESVLMQHVFVIHFIALINALALWVFGLLEEDDSPAESTKPAE